MLKILREKIPWKMILCFLGLVTFLIYQLTSPGTTSHDYFIRLADSFLHGKYYLETNPEWLNELVPMAKNQFMVVYPPTPAIVLMPFVYVFGITFQQQILSQIMGAIAAFMWGLIAYQKSDKKIFSLWIFLIAAFGNIVWFLSSVGSVWYLGQVSAFLFLTITIYESLHKKTFLAMLFFSLAFLSRLQVILSLPIIVFLNRKSLRNKKTLVLSTAILGLFILLFGIYNYLRFGSFLETGYSLIPGVLMEPWYSKGIFNISYIPNNIRVFFASFPIVEKTFPYIIPSWSGLAIWITSPVFIYSLTSDFRKRITILTFISILLIAVIIFSHGSTGFTQFGYRFAVDFYPLVLLLITATSKNTKLKWHHWTLLGLSIFVNMWGVIFINKFNFVGW